MPTSPTMIRRTSFCAAMVLALLACVTGLAGQPARDDGSLVFDAGRFTAASATIDGQVVPYRAYEGLVYVARPVDAVYQSLNLYIPAAYFEGGSVAGFTATTAPIFLPNAVGGYMPARPGGLGAGPGGNASLLALSKGFLVAAPGARGRSLRDAAGRFTGKAPAAIVDLKAAVRYLKFNDDRMPGDARKIVSNGTSAGGALSALLGASGNHPDYASALTALGAAKASDDIFAVSAYCPITNLEHADMAYEWQFNGVDEYVRGRGGPATARMTDAQIALSARLAADFPAYVNSLGLTGPGGVALTLDPGGNGPFRQFVAAQVVASAQRALAAGADLSAVPWLTVTNGSVVALDFPGYVRAITRMKVTPAFDALGLTSPENDLFGSADVAARHFTPFGLAHSTAQGTLADPAAVRQMNAMAYIGAPGATTAAHWRIRHGALDRDTSLAVPVILATALANRGRAVDFAVPWGVGHGGNYDLPDLFAWLARICR